MVEVDIKRMKEMAKLFYRMKKPLYVHGSMGIGKSDGVRQAAQEIAEKQGLKYAESLIDIKIIGDKVQSVNVEHHYKDPEKHFFLMDVRITSLDPSDLRGIPFPDQGVVKWLSPNWLPKMGKGILFFDEMNLAPPSIQASAYQLVLDRKVGDYVLPDDWSIVAAGNLASDKANIFPMAAPLKNRFSHLTLLPPAEHIEGGWGWRDWAMQNNIHADVIAFMAFKPSMLHKFDGKSKEDAFPTHRTWALSSDMIEGLTDEEEIRIVVASCVGEGAANEYMGFRALKKKINLDDLLKNPEKVKKITDISLKYSLVSGLAERYKAEKLSKPATRQDKLDKILAVAGHLDAEFGVFLLRMLKGIINDQTFVKDVMNAKNWMSLYKQYGKYLI